MEEAEIAKLKEERQDLMELSKIAHKSQDSKWMNEILGRLGEIDFELYWNGEGR